ncbi:MAG TPA: ethanolamine ammonia-lyase subunit EutC [Beijerinckiaceae bacterium]|jgi:ethanolamine ammonia-lyase small subunit
MSAPPDEFWRTLAAATPARVALGRAGPGLPTREALRFALAHARARDAVHAGLDAEGLAAALNALGLATVQVESAAPNREVYLARPDLGRCLSDRSRGALEAFADSRPDIALVVADGLSAKAVAAQAGSFLAAFLPRAQGWRLSPAVIATQARVALGDEIGAILGARLTLMLIGERPGLSAPDSLGLYLTHDPKPGRHDAERNCLSNIRPAGLTHDLAAFKAAWLVSEALTRRLTGVALKDDSDGLLAGSASVAAIDGTSTSG